MNLNQQEEDKTRRQDLTGPVLRDSAHLPTPWNGTQEPLSLCPNQEHKVTGTAPITQRNHETITHHQNEHSSKWATCCSRWRLCLSSKRSPWLCRCGYFGVSAAQHLQIHRCRRDGGRRHGSTTARPTVRRFRHLQDIKVFSWQHENFHQTSRAQCRGL